MHMRIDLGWLMTALLAAIGGTASCGGTAEGTDGASGSGGRAPLSQCTPTASALGGGFEACDEGFLHRASAGSCPLPSQALRCDPAQSVDVTACATDADCTVRPNGYCAANGSYPGGLNDPCRCMYSCMTDADCETGTICSCGGTAGGTCAQASCTTDAECSGTFCASASTGCLGIPQFHCFSPSDDCNIDSDCDDGQMCQFDSVSAKRSCVPNGCAGIGRPFLVQGAERRASPATRADWFAEGFTPDVAGLDAALRSTLAGAWTRVALMEHASIAAFARFALELLSLGAPAELIEQTQAAMADETRHARLCFALACAYGQTTIGPGRLDVTDALVESRLENVVRTAILEGCAGETLAAAEAAEAARRATDPVIAAILQGIAEDEARHAALAWRFVAWAIDSAPPESRAQIAVQLESIVDAYAARASSDEPPLELAHHGFVVGEHARALRAKVASELVVPCAARLARRARNLAVSGMYGDDALNGNFRSERGRVKVAG